MGIRPTLKGLGFSVPVDSEAAVVALAGPVVALAAGAVVAAAGAVVAAGAAVLVAVLPHATSSNVNTKNKIAEKCVFLKVYSPL